MTDLHTQARDEAARLRAAGDDGVADLVDALRKENERLRKWAELGSWVMAGWPELGDIDGFTLHDIATKCGVLVEIPGGYDPDHHFDSIGVAPEPGDPWFEIIRDPTPHGAVTPETKEG